MSYLRRVPILLFLVLLAFLGISTVSAAWNIQTIDNSGNVGEYTSLALDLSGYPHISYYDDNNLDLKYIYWDGTQWIKETVDSSGSVGRYTSLAMDNNGYPHISYYDYTNSALKYAYWDGSQWNLQTVESGGVGWFTSIAMDSNGYPQISYYDITNSALKYASWTGTSWNIEIVDNMGDVGWSTSLALDGNNYPHISYYDYTNSALKYASWTGTQWVLETVDNAAQVGVSTSLALDSNGYPHISYSDYTNFDLKYAYWTGLAWNIEIVDSTGQVGGCPSLTIDSNGYPHISYYDWTNSALKYAYWTGSQWIMETVDQDGDVGWGSSIELNGAIPHISYQDTTNGALKYAIQEIPVTVSKKFLDAYTWQPISNVFQGELVYGLVEVTNTGSAPISGVTMVDAPSAGLDFFSTYWTSMDNGATWTYNDPNFNPDTGEWNIGNLNPDATVLISILYKATGTGMVSNTATADGASDTAQLTIDTLQADIGVSKTFLDGYTWQPTTTASMGSYVYSLVQVYNNGPDTAHNVQATDTISPADGLTSLGSYYTSYDNGVTWNYMDGSFNPNTGVWDVGTVESGDSYLLAAVYRVDSPSEIENTIIKTRETEYDPNPLNNQDTATLNSDS